jgi:hypothetical protein
MAVVGALLVAAASPGVEAQDSAEQARPHKSVRGKLLSVDTGRNAVVMKSDAGETLSWRFEASVIKEASAFKPGDPMIVIYRQLPGNEKRVTALAFPGTEKTPTYVNMTGGRVVLRSAPAVDGACEKAGDGAVTESVIPPGGRAEVLEPCWCCAVSGESCTPTTKSGLGRAFLARCFR